MMPTTVLARLLCCLAMLPPCQPTAIRDELRRILEALLERDPPAGDADADGSASVSALAAALVEALDTLACQVHGPAPAPGTAPGPGLERVGDHVIDLIQRLADRAEREQAGAEARQLRGLLLATACCVVRSGGELSHLQPVASAAAEHASLAEDPAQFLALFHVTDDIARGLSGRFSGSAPGSARFQAWRVLLINRAIIATRTLEPRLMESAFEALVDELPADAPTFFQQGMQQMDRHDFPPQVRAVMQRYHDARGPGERLH
jgi:hypothetical protein